MSVGRGAGRGAGLRGGLRVGLGRRASAVWGASLAGMAVVLGAFGVHTLARLVSADRLQVWETAVRFEMYHALGLLLIAALPGPARLASLLLLVGTLIFSGTLYLLVVTGVPILGAVTPLGGLLLIAGWALLAVSLARRLPASD
ncbi:MAG TPA: DUF423 domain-containing protein [Trueperaceae bacterium]|nr:DUF423 domain-containing protein [Trueperaceae bacterium]